ncbi:putative phage tail assembly chaperone [uncultured Mediterranean phage uvMED]|nr:putative phage tail assembly chaperone [uncultured Mediterranean phage uvMED]|tara:strand:+ start:885 stop:1241 length:357 start_codon:yes stop_codon:yes gene_type:complete
MPATQRTVDMLVGAFDLNQRRKFELKNAEGKKVLDLFFKPITRADRKRAQNLANSEEALDISTQMLCQMAELEDGTKAFASADAPKLQRELPESVLNELELFLFGLGDDADLQDAKND